MSHDVRSATRPAPVSVRADGPTTGDYQPPAFEVIELACEITAYAPAGDEPLF